jgi:hypothetical protein
VCNLGDKHFAMSPAVRFFTIHTMGTMPQLCAQSMDYVIAKLAEKAIRPLINARLHLSAASGHTKCSKRAG